MNHFGIGTPIHTDDDEGVILEIGHEYADCVVGWASGVIHAGVFLGFAPRRIAPPSTNPPAPASLTGAFFFAG